MLNRLTIIGRTGNTPELKRTNSGTAVTTFSLACERDFRDKDGAKETDWIECCAWRQTAEYLCQYAGKGSMIAVDGRLQTRAWQDKDGNNRKSVEIVVDRAYIMPDGKKDSYEERNADPNIPAAVAEFAEVKEDGELPF